jgi:hypothetical protein
MRVARLPREFVPTPTRRDAGLLIALAHRIHNNAHLFQLTKSDKNTPYLDPNLSSVVEAASQYLDRVTSPGCVILPLVLCSILPDQSAVV